MSEERIQKASNPGRGFGASEVRVDTQVSMRQNPHEMTFPSPAIGSLVSLAGIGYFISYSSILRL